MYTADKKSKKNIVIEIIGSLTKKKDDLFILF